MNENKKPIEGHVIFFCFLILVILCTFLGKIVFGETETTKLMPTVVKGEHYEWTWEDEVLKIVSEPLKDTEKEIIVRQVANTVLVGKDYTIRVGLQGSRKPIPKIKGTNDTARIIEFLDKANLGYTYDTWVNMAEKYKIEMTTPICIAWADSHLGKALASKNNIGNVGNNDRGDRVHYDSMEKGIEAIFRALNNKWMGGSTMIGQLSGEGRKRLNIEGCNETKSNQKCYATSMGVWSTNVTNCLSILHDREIREDYQFRLQ